ncbi:hypothetical protein AYO49_01515 [Verrucomicrobiaceae bacterium SCGC AG-212-N21]|nr:hypothetical protein AYO49_01515 [Verrucomicrobiaceae bacterium SCGC AG-212-N21]
MTRKQLETVIEEGVPFSIHLADGKSYKVPHRDYVSLPPKNATVAVVYEDDGTVHVLPLLTMTGLTYRTKGMKSAK